jgi:hypothetical protein
MSGSDCKPDGAAVFAVGGESELIWPKVALIKAAAALHSFFVGVVIWSNPCLPRFGVRANRFWCCITTSKNVRQPFRFISVIE